MCESKAQNAEIVGIAVDFREDVLKFVQETPLQYPLLIGEEDGLAAAEAFGMGMAFPFTVFVDSQNRILTVKIGELHEDEANFAFDRLHDIDNGILTRRGRPGRWLRMHSGRWPQIAPRTRVPRPAATAN